MKSRFLSLLLLASAFAPTAFAFSLYDTAPSVGMPESHAISYTARASIGYDDNLDASPSDKEDGMFTQLGVGASYSDRESVTAISYNVNLGVRLYDRAAEGSSRELFSDCNLTASLTHSFSAVSTYTTSFTLSYSPDLNLADSISASYTQGEVLRWSWSNAYSRAIDSRWSWSASVATNGNIHSSNSYEQDDRHNLTGGLTLSYRSTPLTTYSLSSSFRRDFRREGEGSENAYFNLGLSHSLTPVSSLNITAGIQVKTVASNTDLYPSLRFGYRREIEEGLSANVYFSLDNENVDTGYTRGNMYLSNETLRAGANLSYALTHKVTFHVDASVLRSSYSKHTGDSADYETHTWVLSAGMNYKFTKSLSGFIDYQYTTSEQRWGDYQRNKVSTGVTYTF